MSFYAICPVDKEAYKLEGNDLLDKLVCPNCGVSDFSSHEVVGAHTWGVGKKIEAPPQTRELRPLTGREQCVMDKYTRLGEIDYGREYQIHLKIDQQSFALSVEPESKEHAEWHRRMLAIALARMADNDV